MQCELQRGVNKHRVVEVPLEMEMETVIEVEKIVEKVVEVKKYINRVVEVPVPLEVQSSLNDNKSTPPPQPIVQLF